MGCPQRRREAVVLMGCHLERWTDPETGECEHPSHEVKLSAYLVERGYVYVRECPDCGGQIVSHKDEAEKEYPRAWCTSYGQCENAPG